MDLPDTRNYLNIRRIVREEIHAQSQQEQFSSIVSSLSQAQKKALLDFMRMLLPPAGP